ncbi:MAG: hypothetical protein H6622_14720 [Halobacteriovoraceae bacterium]|nr:hypothetical protein [Halobacteriovoraceae bacterium]
MSYWLKILVNLILFLNSIWAIEVTYGPEFEFRHKGQLSIHAFNALYNLPLYLLYYPIHLKKHPGQILNFSRAFDIQKTQDYISYLRDNYCDDTQCTLVEENYRPHLSPKRNTFLFESGLHYSVVADFMATEISMGKLTLNQILDHKMEIDEFIFKRTKSYGLSPVKGLEIFSTFQINIGFADVFEKNPLLFLNFLIDLANFSSLSNGTLGKDTYNAKNIYHRVNSPRNLKIIVNDARKALDENQFPSSMEIANDYYKYIQGSNRGKGDSVNVWSIIDPDTPISEKRIEIRFLRMVNSMEKYISLIKIFQQRIESLSNESDVLEFYNIGQTTNKLDQVEDFLRYVGGDFSFLSILPKKYEKYVKKIESLHCEKSFEQKKGPQI